MAVYQNSSDSYAVAVNPFEGGTQVLTVLGDASAPTSFTYGVAGLGEEVVIEEDGSAGVIDTESGETVSVIETPWAVVANGTEIPSRSAHQMEDGEVLMKETFNTAVIAIGFFWVGLICAPGSGPDGDIIWTGLIGTVAAALAFGLGGYVKRQRKPGATTRPHR
jgi:hypothetical protein